jgi:predicted GNAT family acetyltransferase
MAWWLTDDVETYAERAWDVLARRPAVHSVALTVIESVRAGHRWSGDPMTFGWYDDGEIRGAVSLTPPYELLLAVVPEDTVAELVAALRAGGVKVPGVNGTAAAVDRFVAAWSSGTRLRAVPALRLRLYRLATLSHPTPPPGRARPASMGDLETAVRWMRAFEGEAGVPATDVESMMRMRIAAGGVWLWEDETRSVVSLAGRTPTVAGVARIAPVYTPPDQRRRGYGAAVAAACTADAVSGGAEQVVLFTDLANPTSNSIYRQIGFRPVGDYRVVRFAD